jgi:hypothetical protein
MTSIDQFSLTTTPIEQFFNETALGTATGFVWVRSGKYYLITNWHVVTCRMFPTGQYLKSHAGRPNVLRAHFNLAARQDFGKQQYDLKIRDVDDNPLWLVHPQRSVDIAAVPLPLTDGQLQILKLYPINELPSFPFKLYIGMDVFILGYPFGVRLPAYPVWKRGSIASEPDLASFTDTFLMVDTASRPGMSGAPVIVRHWGTDKYVIQGTTEMLPATTRTKFIGVYSGRMPTETALEAQIGMVWPAAAIDEIIACGQCDHD